MLCQKCQSNQATIKLIKNINGNITEQYLCKACANGEDINFKDFYKDNLFDNFFNAFSPSISSPLMCDRCQTTYNEFKKTGKLGCSDCFFKFQGYLDSTLKNIHGSTTHTGKYPKRCGEHLKLKKEKNELKRLLSEAISNENYEEAAILRDRIKEMEG